MMRAYPECYLETAKLHLAGAFDYAVRECQVAGSAFANMLAVSQAGQEFAKGSPWALCGLSGIELAQQVLAERLQAPSFPEPVAGNGRSVPYWVGWSVAIYQWASAESFQRVFELASYDELVRMYPVYHEQDVSSFVRDMALRRSELLDDGATPTRLKQLREQAGLSQSELARAASVGLRSIQMYEQRNNDIDKAQGAALARMAKVLGCQVEDLLENPFD